MNDLKSAARRVAAWLRDRTSLPGSPRARPAVRGKPLYLDDYPSFGEFDREALRRLVRGVRSPRKRVLEIGSWLGAGSTRVFIEELKPDRDTLVCVDTWRGSPNVQKHLDIAEAYDLLGTFLYNVAKAGGRDLVKPMVMASLDAAAWWPMRPSTWSSSTATIPMPPRSRTSTRGGRRSLRAGCSAATIAKGGSRKPTGTSTRPTGIRTMFRRRRLPFWSTIPGSSSRYTKFLEAQRISGPKRISSLPTAARDGRRSGTWRFPSQGACA